MQLENRKSFIKGFKDSVPIMLGYFAVSFTLGINASAHGLSWLEAGLMSFLNHTSAGQAAGIAMIANDDSYLSVALSQAVINLRYLLMSAALALKLKKDTSLGLRLSMSYVVSDEIFGISALQKAPLNGWYNIGSMAAASPGWVLGTILGAVMGNVLRPDITMALSVALYSMFIAVVFPPIRHNAFLAVVVSASMALSYAFSVIKALSGISYGIKVILITIALSAFFAIIRPIEEQDNEA